MKLALVNVTKDMEAPPLGLVYIATYLKNKFENLQIKLIDINFDDIVSEIFRFKPDLIGISAFTVVYPNSISFAKKIKKELNVPIILGGVHISNCPNSLDKIFDFAVVGEGERTFTEVISLYNKKRIFLNDDLRKINGLLFFDDKDNLVKTPSREFMDLKKVPIPDRSFLNKNYFLSKVSYNKIKGEKVIETGILTSRGCPFNCVFCATKAFWKKVRFHDLNFVADEIEYLYNEFGVNYIVIYDDLFALSVERPQKLCVI